MLFEFIIDIVIYFIISALIINIIIQNNKITLYISDHDIQISNKFFNKIKIKFWKEKLPSVSGFDKTHIKNMNAEYLNYYLFQIKKAHTVHILAYFVIIPVLFFNIDINQKLFVIMIIIIINTPYYLITKYNKERFDKISKLIRKRRI